MKTILSVVCLLAATTVVRGMDQDAVIAKYMEYLMPDVQPCADELKITEQDVTNIQSITSSTAKLGCLKACVMKRMSILTGMDFHLEPIYKMIEVVHAGNAEDIAFVRNIASDCTSEIQGVTDECVLGDKYTDCYIEKLFNQ
ncbi:uncharacterized protein LOC143181663 [Calliopsis andreniformis]|uniref:uncharacterized protein LOC143181663 n=1 Tax=Calliopsis andreniformis TaxID=337506 RepID=UPI003FCD58B3